MGCFNPYVSSSISDRVQSLEHKRTYCTLFLDRRKKHGDPASRVHTNFKFERFDSPKYELHTLMRSWHPLYILLLATTWLPLLTSTTATHTRRSSSTRLLTCPRRDVPRPLRVDHMDTKSLVEILALRGTAAAAKTDPAGIVPPGVVVDDGVVEERRRPVVRYARRLRELKGGGSRRSRLVCHAAAAPGGQLESSTSGLRTCVNVFNGAFLSSAMLLL